MITGPFPVQGRPQKKRLASGMVGLFKTTSGHVSLCWEKPNHLRVVKAVSVTHNLFPWESHLSAHHPLRVPPPLETSLYSPSSWSGLTRCAELTKTRELVRKFSREDCSCLTKDRTTN